MQTKSTYRQLAETGLLMLLGFSTAASAREIYVSPTGTGTGTVAAPFGSIQSAVDAAAAGDVIYLRAGTYKPSANIQIGKSGTRTQPITFRAFGAEKVILDGENMPGYVPATRSHHLQFFYVLFRFANLNAQHPLRCWSGSAQQGERNSAHPER